ncbi:hypothetical protein [Pontibacter ruber]|uniref:Uncharacterized protein n=1 Tax=Pontibacter ruber TaxID=1343895 RepID=A0ABW5CZV8_9BACT|nr:hypothetical protein [Pontibacter ruber]
MGWLRSFFGLSDSSENRTVVGNAVNTDAADAHYIRDSNARLHALQNLCNRYAGTPHAAKLQQVFEKSKYIHRYLLSKKRAQALELFHLQHTDHFITAFTVILDVHQQHLAHAHEPVREQPRATQAQPKAQPSTVGTDAPFEAKVESMLKKIESETIKGIYTAHKVTEMVKRVAGQAPFVQSDVLRPPMPAVTVPIVAIDTYSKISYVRQKAAGFTMSGEISFTSPPQDIEAFLSHLSARLGIDKSTLSYHGNALLVIPDGKGPSPEKCVPIIHWQGCAYAINLNDYRLFPVRTYKRSL